jgi:hypothetical protein
LLLAAALVEAQPLVNGTAVVVVLVVTLQAVCS